MTSIMETHLGWVQKLKDRGEEVLQPKVGEPMNSIKGYIKTQHPHKEAGSIFKDEDGMFGLFGDMGALHITGIEWEELGLCDSRCWYEWMSPYKPETPEPNHVCGPYIDVDVVAHRCTKCGKTSIYEINISTDKLKFIGTLEAQE